MSEQVGAVESFITDAICEAPARIRKAHNIGKCGVAGADQEGTIFVIELNGEPMVIDVIVKERKA